MFQHRDLKLVYRNKRRIITYIAGSTYNQILKKIMLHFEIPRNQKSLLVLTNEAGKVFSRRQLYKYLFISPDPRIIFYVQHRSKCRHHNKNNRDDVTYTWRRFTRRAASPITSVLFSTA